MNATSAVLLFLSLVFSVLLGAQTRSWSWGPSVLLMAAAVATAVPTFWKKPTQRGNEILFVLGTLAAAWISWRAANSPVRELAMADLMLLAAAVGAFVVTESIMTSRLADRLFTWGLVAVGISNLTILGLQIADPNFSAIFTQRPANYPSGFFSHYNEGANFLIGSSFLIAGIACFGQQKLVTRMFLGLVALAGLVGVYYTRSRGGIFAVAAGSVVFGIFAIVHGTRQKAKWVTPLTILFPICLVLLGGLLLKSWASAQEFRFSVVNADPMSVMDNGSRLSLLGIAFSCISFHPLAGGGSRSFSWECFQAWERQANAYATRPEMVHNELLQAATDYGLIGAGLILILLLGIFILALIRSAFSEKSIASSEAQAWCIGGIAGLLGMLCQSCFSFVFHLLPGSILLGICLARASAASSAKNPKSKSSWVSPSLLSSAALFSVCFLLIQGWTTTKIGIELFPIYFKATSPISDEEKVGRLSAAITESPQAIFYSDRGFIYQKWFQNGNSELSSENARDAAINDYRKAALLHPYNATITINLANLLSAAEDDAAAEAAYQKTLTLQGGMEAGFRGHFFYAEYLLKKGTRHLNAGDYAIAQETFEKACDQVSLLATQTPWLTGVAETVYVRIGIYEGLGLAREANEDYKGALAAYQLMSNETFGAAGQYRSAALFAKLAAQKWAARQPSEALSLFLKAQEKTRSVATLPSGISASQKLELTHYIEQSISFLQKARITPTEP